MNWTIIVGLVASWAALSHWAPTLARAWWLRPGVQHKRGDYTWGMIRSDVMNAQIRQGCITVNEAGMWCDGH